MRMLCELSEFVFGTIGWLFSETPTVYDEKLTKAIEEGVARAERERQRTIQRALEKKSRRTIPRVLSTTLPQSVNDELRNDYDIGRADYMYEYYLNQYEGIEV